jgi:hypothetical protein
VGHVFYLGTKYSDPLRAKVKGNDGIPLVVEMGCYGIGVSRVMAAIVETVRRRLFEYNILIYYGEDCWNEDNILIYYGDCWNGYMYFDSKKKIIRMKIIY